MDDRNGPCSHVVMGQTQRRVLIGMAAGVLTVGLLVVVLPDRGEPPRTVSTADDEASTTTSPEPVVSMSTTSTTEPPTTTEAPTTTTEYPAPRFRGQAVDPGGHPLAGIYVYVSREEPASFAAPLLTDDDGRYEVECPFDWFNHPGGQSRSGLVLSGVRINDFVGDHRADRNWVPATVRSPDDRQIADWCGRDPATVVTTMRPGGIITGTFEDPNEPPYTYVPGAGGTTYSIRAELIDIPYWPSRTCAPFCFDLEGLVGADQRFTIIGVPPGRTELGYLNGQRGAWPWVIVTAGQTTEVHLTAPNPPSPSTTMP